MKKISLSKLFITLCCALLSASLSAKIKERDKLSETRAPRFDCCDTKVQRVCKRDTCKVECPVTCIDKVPFRIKESGCYLVTANLSHAENCPAISVEVDHVKIEFCVNASLCVGGSTTGIQVCGNDVRIINGTFNAKSINARAIELCSGIKDWTIDRCNFNDFEEAISSTNFANGLLINSDFCQCRFGFHQNGTDSLIKRFDAENIRAEFNNQNVPACPGFDFANNDNLSWVIALDGEAIDSTIKQLQLNSTTIYCFKCRNCIIDNIELDYPNVKCQGTVGIQCGGPRGAGLFRFFQKVPPAPAEIKQGCINCKVSNVKVRMVSESIFFMVGIAAFFCTNCEMTDNLVLVNGGQAMLNGAGIIESYCTNCVIRRCQAEGPCLIGLHVCDNFDIGEFCFASVTEDCKARNCWFGITQIRCFGSVTKNSITTQNKIGILMSEGATNPVVDNCFITENGIGILYAILGSCNLACFSNCFSGSFTPDTNTAVSAPCNGLVSNCILNGNITAILQGPVDPCNPTGPKLVLETANNIIRQAIPNCGAQPVMTDICQCLLENNCPVPCPQPCPPCTP